MTDRIPIINRDQWLAMRKQDVTASDMGAVFGLSPYKTPLALWAEKSGVGLEAVETSAMRRGRWLEDAVITACKEQHPQWDVVKPGYYLRDGDNRLGATPDACTDNVVIQCKTVADRVFKTWQDAAPAHYQLQALTEAMLMDTERALLAVLVISPYGAEYHEYDIPRHAAAEEKIRDGVRKFWSSVESKEAPPAEYSADADLIDKLYGPDASKPPIDLSRDNRLPFLLEEHDEVQKRYKSDEKRLYALKAEIVEKLNGSTVATMPGWQISNKMQSRREMVVKATSFPVLRIKRQQEKPE